MDKTITLTIDDIDKRIQATLNQYTKDINDLYKEV